MGKVAAKAPKNKPTDYLPYNGEGPWWTADSKGEAKLQASETGYGSYDKVPLKTLPEVFAAAVKTHGNKPALRTENMPPLKKGEDIPAGLPLDKWKTWSWIEYQADVRNFAKAAISVGMEHFDSVNIFGFNTPEWAIAMYGAIFAGGRVAGIYPSDTEDSVQYKSDHSNGAVAVVETKEHFDKFRAVADNLPKLKAIVCWTGDVGEDFETSDGRSIKTFSFADFVALGAKQDDTELEARLGNIKPGHCAALVYTSGTTGRPKAVMLSHDACHYQGETVFSLVFKPPKKTREERMLSYLPLSHVAGMMVDLIGPLVITGSKNYDGFIITHFARSYDLKRSSIVQRLQTVKPTSFLGVPRVWEKIMEKLLAVGATTKGFKKRLATFAKSKAAKYTSSRQLGGKGKTPKTMGLANIVLNKVKAKLGLDKCVFMLSGAAPLSFDVIEYFGSLNININEAYGMSETCAVVTIGNEDYHVWGSVGFEIPGTEVRVLNKDLSEAPNSKDLFRPTEEEQGELCFRGRGMMMGYMANERLGADHVAEIEEKNSGTIDEHGWLHSGDKGTKDVRGMVKITGRYKELIIGAGGENIAPVPIEDEIKKLCPFISNVVMVGNKRKFNVMLITLKTVGATGELPGSQQLDGPAASLSKAKTITEAMNDETFAATITKAITDTNNNIEVVPSKAARVQKFTILPRDFSVLTEELTATLKLKRSVVENQYEPIIDKMFEVEDVYVKYELAPTEGLDIGLNETEPIREKQLSQNFVKHAVEDAVGEEKA